MTTLSHPTTVHPEIIVNYVIFKCMDFLDVTNWTKKLDTERTIHEGIKLTVSVPSLYNVFTTAGQKMCLTSS